MYSWTSHRVDVMRLNACMLIMNMISTYVKERYKLQWVLHMFLNEIEFSFYRKKITCSIFWLLSVSLHFYFQSNLNGHKNIIGYLDSSITHIGGGVHELLLLMPYCKSQVLQMMNNRLRMRWPNFNRCIRYEKKFRNTYRLNYLQVTNRI